MTCMHPFPLETPNTVRGNLLQIFLSSAYLLSNPKRNVALRPPFINVKTTLLFQVQLKEGLCNTTDLQILIVIHDCCKKTVMKVDSWSSIPFPIAQWSGVPPHWLGQQYMLLNIRPWLVEPEMEPPGAASPWGGQGRCCPMAERVSQPCWARASRGENSW